ncbi:MAG: replicative DNA helicase [Peptostreptococcaceae bacterium]|nr:replicative DNA helicase [Peptostreptococcaceae bacterium]
MPEHLYSQEAEQSVLGCMILDSRTIDYIKNLNSDDFYYEAHKDLFNSIMLLNKKNKPIDLVTIVEQLKSIGKLEDVGGVSYITSLSTIVPNTSSIGHYIDIVKGFSDKRRMIIASYKFIENIRGGKDIDSSLEIFEKSTNIIDEVKEYNNTLDYIMSNIFDKLNDKPQEKIKTNIAIIDKHTNGIGKKELIAIGAGSGVGKSAIALKISIEAYKKGKKVMIISREMSKEQVAERIILSETGISKFDYENRNFTENDWVKLTNAMSNYYTKNIIIDDQISTIQGIKRAIRVNKPDLVIVDYVQLLTPSSIKDTRERQVAELSRELKNITLDFGVPVIQLTQLAEKGNGNFRPRGESYTRESRAIYHDSNIVIYLHRVTEEKELNEAYKRTIFNERGSFDDMKATIEAQGTKGNKFLEIIVDKNRNGTTGSNYYWFKGSDLNYYPIV